MTSQQLADELALIAFSAGITMRSHQILGSLDALEAFRRERLPGWEWDSIDRESPTEWTAGLGIMGHGPVIRESGPDEWSARASALIAAS